MLQAQHALSLTRAHNCTLGCFLMMRATWGSGAPPRAQRDALLCTIVLLQLSLSGRTPPTSPTHSGVRPHDHHHHHARRPLSLLSLSGDDWLDDASYVGAEPALRSHMQVCAPHTPFYAHATQTPHLPAAPPASSFWPPPLYCRGARAQPHARTHDTHTHTPAHNRRASPPTRPAPARAQLDKPPALRNTCCYHANRMTAATIRPRRTITHARKKLICTTAFPPTLCCCFPLP